MTFGSLFTGIGGIDLGLERAGMECRWQVEIDPFCNRVLERHWPKVKRYRDITTLTGDELERVDWLAGGFPCQDLSQAGKRVGIEGARSGLWFEFARLIGKLRPTGVLIENVPGLLVYDAMRRVIGELSRLGYVGFWRSLRASEFGAAHLRKRIFIVAYDPSQFGRREPIGIRRRAVPASASAAGTNMANGQSRGFGELREPSRSNGQPNGCNKELGDSPSSSQTARSERRRSWRAVGKSSEPLADSSDRQFQEQGRGSQRRDGAGPASPALPHAGGTGLSDTEQAALSGTLWNQEGRTASELRSSHLADSNGEHRHDGRYGAEQICWERREAAKVLGMPFAPGPADPRWAGILQDFPGLAPALKSPVRGMADGLPDWMVEAMSDRTKRLGKLGNAVVPQVAEWIGRRLVELSEGERSQHV